MSARGKVENPYAGRPYEALRAIRKDLLNIRTGHIREAERLMAESRRVGAAMKDARREPVAISDHAIVRWLERVRGVDTAAIRQEILNHIDIHDTLGDGVLVQGDGIRVVLNEGRVTTILTADQFARRELAEPGRRHLPNQRGNATARAEISPANGLPTSNLPGDL